jgi:hypothetical protein
VRFSLFANGTRSDLAASEACHQPEKAFYGCSDGKTGDNIARPVGEKGQFRSVPDRLRLPRPHFAGAVAIHLPPTPRRRCGRRLRVAGSRVKRPTEGGGAEYVLVGAHIRASAACSAGRPARAAIASAIATSALVGFTRTSAVLSKPFADTCRSKSLPKCGSKGRPTRWRAFAAS